MWWLFQLSCSLFYVDFCIQHGASGQQQCSWEDQLSHGGIVDLESVPAEGYWLKWPQYSFKIWSKYLIIERHCIDDLLFNHSKDYNFIIDKTGNICFRTFITVNNSMLVSCQHSAHHGFLFQTHKWQIIDLSSIGSEIKKNLSGSWG